MADLTKPRKRLYRWIVAGLIAAFLFLLGVAGAIMTKGYNDDFCFSSRVTPPQGWTSGQIESRYFSRTVECTYQLQDGRTVTVRHEAGTYTFWFFLTLAYGAPLVCLAALLFAGARRGLSANP
ncbi:MAG: hypothetical protein M3285_02585 [Actinomycetota bacterium]|nr:hypothetical protein [Actinomycetota bacterium]